MIDFKPFDNLIMFLMVLFPFGAWKVIEIFYWFATHIQVR